MPAQPQAEPPDGDEAIRAALLRIADLDAEQGLLSVRNRLQTYRRLLSKYLDIHAKDMDLVRERLAAGDFDEARRLAHSLKGVSATLGAREVRTRAHELEIAIEERLDSVRLEACIGAVEQAWQPLTTALRQALPP
jgi:two-component system, sensor histidine kinase and response regulator